MSSSQIPALRVPSWDGMTGLVHAFLGRAGGVSAGAYASLNMSFNVGDLRSNVEENHARVQDRVADGIELVTMTQVHGATVAAVTRGISAGEADAMVTDSARIGLCVLTADCTPIFLVAARAHAVAAVHAGWRGTVAGVARAAVTKLTELYDVRPEELSVAMGPTIGSCCYEVDAEIADDIEAKWGEVPQGVRRYRRDGQPKATLDLRRINTKLFVDCGVAERNISLVGGCTCCDGDEYFSHRRATRAEAVTGRQVSLIGWTG